MYARILAPIDGSPTSNRGLMEAIKLAAHNKARLRLLHVVDESFLMYDMYASGYAGEAINGLRSGGEELIAQAKASAIAQGVEAESNLVETINERVAGKILDEARQWRADLIVMGTHGRRGFMHFALGSDAEAVLHGATIPVLLIKAAGDSVSDWRAGV